MQGQKDTYLVLPGFCCQGQFNRKECLQAIHSVLDYQLVALIATC